MEWASYWSSTTTITEGKSLKSLPCRAIIKSVHFRNAQVHAQTNTSFFHAAILAIVTVLCQIYLQQTSTETIQVYVLLAM